jgi:4-amino-4-deoxy-L-arabinose transferase-like glycosyltransferase
MISRLLSIAGPLWVYASIVVLVYGIWNERRKLDWLALVPAVVGLIASAAFLVPIHRLFFDEDIYINIANNLSRAPVNQVTVVGDPDGVKVSSYYKEPPGWPVLLSLVFRLTGTSESVAFWVARMMFALAIAAVFHLAREVLESRKRALIAAICFGATPVCFWFSLSAGTDIPAALLATVGMWGLFAANAPLAAAGFALAAQTRMELIILVPLIWISSKIPTKWKLVSAGLVVVEISHIALVMSLAPELARAERIPAAFSMQYFAANLKSNAVYLLNPFSFFAIITVLAILAVIKGNRLLIAPAAVLFGVYLVFYAGSFDMNPRYSIQILAPVVVLGASMARGRRMLLLLTIVPAFIRPYEPPAFVNALAADHRIASVFASQIGRQDLVVSAQAEMFLNFGLPAMNAAYATQHKDKLEAEIGKRKVWYHAGVRTSASDTGDALTDQWVKSNFELHPIQSQEVNGMRIAYFLLESVDRKAGKTSTFDAERDRRK